MKKIGILIMTVIICISLFGCGGKKPRETKQAKVTGMDEFRWNMTPKEVKNNIKKYYSQYKITDESKKEIDIEYGVISMMTEYKFYFKKGLLNKISFKQDGNEDDYRELVDENKDYYNKMEEEADLMASTSIVLYSKTTSLGIIYLKGINSEDGSVNLDYEKYKPDEYYNELDSIK